MSLTPNDILQKRFGTAFRGLVADEVYAYLRSVAEELEQALQENAAARKDITRIEEQLAEYRHMEATLRNTLVSSQKVGQEIRAEAEHRRELILREAELEAERRIHDSERRVQELEQDVLRLVAQRRRFEAEFAALIETHSRLLHHNHSGTALDFDQASAKQLAFDEFAGDRPEEIEEGQEAEPT